MADSVIKLSIVENSSLPLLYSPIPYLDESNTLQDGAGYLFRYRVVSDDRTRFSQWSPVQRLLTNPVGSSTIELTGLDSTIINATWSEEVQPLEYAVPRPRYDVFVGWDDAEPTYHGTSYGRSYSFLNDGGVTNVRVIIQVEAAIKNRLAFLEIADSGYLVL